MGIRVLFARLRGLLQAPGATALSTFAGLVRDELGADACSIFGRRPGEILDLRATAGLNPDMVGHLRLRVGEGVVGLAAAGGQVLNLADARVHRNWAERPGLGEDAYRAVLAVPVRRDGRTLGVIALHSTRAAPFDEEAVAAVETVALLLAEPLGASANDTTAGFSGTVPRHFEGATLAPGIVLGAVVIAARMRPPARMLADDPAVELARIEAALEGTRRGIERLIEQEAPATGDSRDVLETSRLVASDAGWLRRVGEAIGAGLSAEAAVHRVAAELNAQMRRIADPYLRERLADLEDLADGVLAALGGGSRADGDGAYGRILLARRLGPAQLLEWHTRGIAGLVIEEGTAGGHAAILARALSLPALGAARGVVDAALDGDEAVLDGEEGTFILRPDGAVTESYARAQAARAGRLAGWRHLREAPCRTRDGTEFCLCLNAGLPLEVEHFSETGAESIGLFRTEIAMLARGAVPDVAEQAALYRRVIDRADGRVVLFRTLDLGSDKLLPDADPAAEENPAMGWRSLRVGLDRPAILKRQLRALLLAADGRKLSVMFPMVATVAELRQAKNLLYAEAARICPAPAELQVGTMLEVPSLLWQLPEVMRECDFVSLGTNDLMQFLFAADRSVQLLQDRYDFVSEPVFRMLDALIAAAAGTNVKLSVCGEAASRPLDALVLLALGITSLSMAASSLPDVKEMLVGADLHAFRSFLKQLRRSAGHLPSLREPVAAWLRERASEV